jgi:hypothetical protein
VATITTRAGKGAALTHQEVDANFTGLNTELGQKEVASNKGIANGYASLDSAGKVPSAQLPSYVDDVVEVANFASLPGTGETGKIYVTIDTNKTYRWSGSSYIEISASPGSTDSLAEGSTNLYFTQARARASISASGSLSYNSSTGVMSFSDAVTSVAGRTGAVTLTSSDVGLGNVENKSSATIRGEITSSNVTTALGFTPLNRATVTGDWNVKTNGQASLISGGTNNHNGTTTTSGIYLPHSTAGYGVQIGGRLNTLWFRTEENNVWDSWRVLLHSGNYNSYSPTLTGTGASGTWGISITGSSASTTGNAATATALQTARAINGVSFNGTANITVADSTKLPLAGGTMTGAITFDAGQTWPTFNQNTTGSAATLTTGRTIGMTGDVTWTSGSFNGSANVTGTATLANSGVAAGTYTKVTVDAKGRVTTGASLASGDLPTYTGSITSSQVTTALGYTPYNSTNPNGYITSSALSSYLPLSGGTLTGSLNTQYVSVKAGAGIYLYRSDNTAYTNWDARADGNQAVPHKYTFHPTHGYGAYKENWWDGDSYHSLQVTSNVLQYDGSTVLHAGNYSSYALPLSGGTITGTLNINGGGSQPLNLTTSSGSPWGFGLTRSDAGVSSKIFLHNGSGSWAWVYEHNPVFYNGGAYSPFLHSGNYNSYSPSLTGGGASGTWAINITGSAGSASLATDADRLRTYDHRIKAPNSDAAGRAVFGFTSWANNNTAPWADYLHLRSYTDSSGGADNLVMFRKDAIGMRIWQQSFGSGSAYSNYVDVLHSSNYSSYALPLSGGVLSGALRATNITAGGGTNTDTSFGVNGSAHFAPSGTFVYWGGSIGTLNSWSSREYSNSGIHQLNVSRWILDRFGYGSQPLIDAYNGGIDLGQYTTIASGARVNGGIRQGANVARPLAEWSASSSSTGMVYIEMPGSTSNYGMIHAVIDVYEYNGNAAATIIVGGHNWVSSWYNVSANVIGSTNKEVRLAVRNGKFVICLGTASSTWEYGTVILRKIHNATFYNNIMDMGAQFVIAQTTSEGLSGSTGDLRALRTPASFNAGGAITQAGNQVLHAGNYGSYALPLSGGTMTGTIYSNASSLIIGQQGGSIRGYLYNDSAGIGFLTSSGSWAAYVPLGTNNWQVNGSITASGNVTAYSDERVKANWRKLDDGFLVNLANVKSGIYDRTDIEITQVGVSAQSLRDVLPHAVIEADDGDLSVAYGNAAMVSAVELAKELVALKHKVTELEARIH